MGSLSVSNEGGYRNRTVVYSVYASKHVHTLLKQGGTNSKAEVFLKRQKERKEDRSTSMTNN